jgi:DNA-binding GntR family transcriptional regulator
MFCHNSPMKEPISRNGLLPQLAYEAVRDAIEKNTLKPGDRVSEYEVARWLSISRTPVREGLRRLADEGVLAPHARRGLVVASLDDEALHELYVVREVLESRAAALAARHASESEIQTLKNLVEAEALIVDDEKRMYEHNKVFHQLIYRAAHNRYLLKYLNAISDSISPQRGMATLVNPGRRHSILCEHGAMVAAIAKRDMKAAAKAAAEHLHAAQNERDRLRQVAMIEQVQYLSRRHVAAAPLRPATQARRGSARKRNAVGKRA